MKRALIGLVALIFLILGYYLGRMQLKNHTKSSVYCIKSSSFNYIQYQDLEIQYSDDKCGEWGGDIETIKINRADINKPLVAEYLFQKIDCNHPYRSKEEPEITKRATKQLGIYGKNLVLKLINELLEKKMNSEPEPVFAGFRNSIFIDDSTLMIEDYPSERLQNFERLKNLIIHE